MMVVGRHESTTVPFCWRRRAMVPSMVRRVDLLARAREKNPGDIEVRPRLAAAGRIQSSLSCLQARQWNLCMKEKACSDTSRTRYFLAGMVAAATTREEEVKCPNSLSTPLEKQWKAVRLVSEAIVVHGSNQRESTYLTSCGKCDNHSMPFPHLLYTVFVPLRLCWASCPFPPPSPPPLRYPVRRPPWQPLRQPL